jgi:hypothetical protein
MTVPDLEDIGCLDGQQIERRQRGGRHGRGGASRNKRREPTILDVVADRWAPASLFALSGVPEVSPVERGRARASDAVLGRAARKEALERATGTKIYPAHPKNL